MKIEPRHQELLSRLTQEDRETVAGWVHRAFPPERVSIVTLASLEPIRLELLETRARNREGGAGQ